MDDKRLLREIDDGETKTLELKETLPPKSEKYVKTLIAFANSAGGKLIVGVRNEDRKIVGIANASQVADTIANALSDLCEPLLAPRIRVAQFEDREIVIAEVQPGPSVPYHFKGKDVGKGTYVRVGATTRMADETALKELLLRGSSQSYDEQVCPEEPFLEKEAQLLCDEINRRRTDDGRREATIRNLENWGLVKLIDGKRAPARALILLTRNSYRFARIQCAQFKGTDRVVFLDRREYGGPLYEQVDEAVQFVLRNIRLGAEIKGLYRKDEYELPLEAIREAIVNAVVHRNLQSNSCVQVALFDDRLEVTSPGALFGGITIEQALEGATALRNPLIAEVFMQMDLFESWGTGLRRIKDACEEAGLPEPEFREIGNMFRVNIFRRAQEGAMDEDVLSHGKGQAVPLETFAKLNDNERLALRLAAEEGRVTSASLVEKAGVSKPTASRVLKNLVDEGLLVWHGKNKTDPFQYYGPPAKL